MVLCDRERLDVLEDGFCAVRGDVSTGVCDALREGSPPEVEGRLVVVRGCDTIEGRGPAVLGLSGPDRRRCARLFSDCKQGQNDDQIPDTLSRTWQR